MVDLTGRQIDRYHIEAQLGEGGMATVYRAFDTRLERQVALKVIRQDAFSPEALSQVLLRFEREAKALAQLSHPNIVKVYDYGVFEGAPYFVMEYIPGGTLKDRIHTATHWREAVTILLPIARALSYAHSARVIHRDIKPGNILLTASGDPTLSDFGIAKILEQPGGQTLTGTGVGIGTPEYMAPEQGMGREVDGRADVYALGIVLYELITGRKPYEADTPMAVVLKHITDPLPNPALFIRDLPVELVQLLEKALAKDAANRYPTMAMLTEALDKLLRLPEKTAVQVQPAASEQATWNAMQDASAASAGSFGAGKPEQAPAKATPTRRSGLLVLGIGGGLLALCLLVAFVVVGILLPRLREADMGGQVLNSATAAPTMPPEPTQAPPPQATPSPVGEPEVTAPPLATEPPAALEPTRAPEGLPAATATEVPSGPFEYEVQEGDTLFGIAEQYGVALSDLLAMNPQIDAGNPTLHVGDRILIPPPGEATPTEVPGLGPGSLRVSPNDGMTQVFVPQGEFLMGSSEAELALLRGMCPTCDEQELDDQSPQRTVYLDAFWLDQSEVTNAQFTLFVAQTGYQTTAERNGFSYVLNLDKAAFDKTNGVSWRDLSALQDAPVVHVSWDDAVAYCAWVGRRLPTEAEWEKAARGPEGWLFPWGNQPPRLQWANFYQLGASLQPVGSYPEGHSGYQAWDMAGNVWEWVADFYAANYYQSIPTANPSGPAFGDGHVYRGGAWSSRAAYELFGLAASGRKWNYANLSRDNLGFRCAQSDTP